MARVPDGTTATAMTPLVWPYLELRLPRPWAACTNKRELGHRTLAGPVMEQESRLHSHEDAACNAHGNTMCWRLKLDCTRQVRRPARPDNLGSALAVKHCICPQASASQKSVISAAANRQQVWLGIHLQSMPQLLLLHVQHRHAGVVQHHHHRGQVCGSRTVS